MSNETIYANWCEQIKAVKTDILEKPEILSQYATWLETSEKHTRRKGEDVYNMMLGLMHSVSDTNLIPGVGWKNFVKIVSQVQKETGLDLGVCEYLQDNVDNSMRSQYLGEEGLENMAACTANENLLISLFPTCIPPSRCDCPYRIAKLEQKSR
ncbi:hypothetical protein GOV14_03220 [Candidatus Pacearchaeota archaeon]|nr:hypothetical protein [Candidatus Pacearchaeota archaeon]